MTSPLCIPVTLPCGAVLPNRLAKAAMSEGLADADNHATARLETLYWRWARSGAGLLLSGNMQVDRWHLERPGNVVLDDRRGFDALARLAAAGRSGGAQFWAQLSHTGRQVVADINPAPLAPSSVEIDVLRDAHLHFARPRAMTEDDIQTAIRQFAFSAGLAKDAGFDGVELHAAHGYLISQFLSPRTNRRTDRWGGDLANRARFLLEVLGAVRAMVGPHFPIGLKLNSSDFLVGGFTHADSIDVVRMLNDAGLDLLELSGGSLEQPKLMGVTFKEEGADGGKGESRPEAFFLEFAGATRAAAKMPVMVTGGFRTRALMEAAVQSGELDIVGLGRPMIAAPETPERLLDGEIESALARERSLNLFHMLPWFNMQLERLGEGRDPDLSLDGATALAEFGPLEAAKTQALLARRAAPAVAYEG